MITGDENVLDLDSGLRWLHNLVNILKATGLYFFLKIHFFFNGGIVDLQCCYFQCLAKRFSHIHTYAHIYILLVISHIYMDYTV